MTQGVTNPKKSGSIGKEIDWTLMVEMPNDQQWLLVALLWVAVGVAMLSVVSLPADVFP